MLKNLLVFLKNHKKITLCLAIATIVLVAGIICAIAIGGKNDGKKANNEGEESIQVVGDYTFKDSDLSKAEWLKLLAEKFGLCNYEQTEPFFKDITTDNEIFSYVQTLVEYEIIEVDEKLNPDDKIALKDAIIQVAKVYGETYVSNRLDKDNIGEEDYLSYIVEKLTIDESTLNSGFSKEEATKLLDNAWEKYLDREFENNSDIVYTEKAVLMSEITEYSYENNVLTFESDKDIKVGDILCLGENAEYIGGLAVKVEKVEKNDKEYRLTVIQPELDEVVESFSLEISQIVDLSGEEYEVTIDEEDTSYGAGGSKGSFYYSSIKPSSKLFLAAKIDEDKKGKIAKLKINLTEGKLEISKDWSEYFADVTLSEAELYNYALDSNKKPVSKFKSGLKVIGEVELKDLILNGNIEYKKGNVIFDLNAGLTANTSLNIEGNVKGKEFKIHTIELPLGWGFTAEIDVLLKVDFKGEVSVVPKITSIVNINKQKGKSINATGKTKYDFESKLECETKVMLGPDVNIKFLSIELIDAYVYVGVGADMEYTTDDATHVTIETYGPILHAGVGENKDTVLSKLGVKVKVKIIDKEKAWKKCPFMATYSYDLVSKDWNVEVGNNETTEKETESSNKNNSGEGGGEVETTPIVDGGNEGTTEAPTQKPVETPTEAPTQKPVENPTEAPTEGTTVSKELIPEGCTYYIAETGITLKAGEKFPDKPAAGDVYTTLDYKYIYKYWFVFLDRPSDSWSVRVIDTNKKEYGDIENSILGEDVTWLVETFSGCANLIKSPKLPDGTGFMFDTFSNCTNLQEVAVIPNSVGTLYGTFMNCESLTSIPNIPAYVMNMSAAFAGCKKLTSVPEIPMTVRYMHGTFDGCMSLTGTITINAQLDIGDYYSYADCFYGVDFVAQNLTLTGLCPILDELQATSVTE